MADATTGLKENLSILSVDERAAAELMVKLGQGHVFAKWAAPGTDDDAKRAMLAHVAALDKQYPGGLSAYVANAKRLLRDSKEGVNPYDGATPVVPTGKQLETGSADFLKAEAAGVALAKHSAFVLVAGGLGERLGYSGIKLELASELTTGRAFLQLYVESILALEARSNAPAKRGDKGYVKVPLVIMTSGDTHELTLAFLEKNNWFGMGKDQLSIVKQEKVPALTNNDAAFAVSGAYKIETKPHGHGDVHALLHSAGHVAAWAKEGRRYVAFIQDTNGLVFHAIPVMFGVSAAEKMQVNSLTVPRKPGEAAGGIVRLEYKDGRVLTVNVEYNQLDPLLKSTVSPAGDVADATGNSPYPGNTNVLVFAIPEYAATLARTGGSVPEFVNPKYADAEKTVFKKPTRLECMMQDYPQLLDASAIVGFTQLDRFLCFSAVKNALVDAVAKAKSGVSPDSASSGEADVYAAWAAFLKLAGMDVAPAQPSTFADVTVQLGPRVVVSPSTAVSLGDVKERVRGGSISARSSLVLEGDVVLDNVTLDGALVVRAAPGASITLKGVTVSNAGWVFEPIDVSDAAQPEQLRIRGYTLAKKEQRVIEYASGTNVVTK